MKVVECSREERAGTGNRCPPCPSRRLPACWWVVWAGGAHWAGRGFLPPELSGLNFCSPQTLTFARVRAVAG